MNGRPYHPQSQGRVERFNRIVVAFFSKTIYREQKWYDQLPAFYYEYNNRVNKATRPETPFQRFFGRPNFAAPTMEMVPIVNLTLEERAFLNQAHLDVEEDNQDSEEISDNSNRPNTDMPETVALEPNKDSAQDDPNHISQMNPYYAALYRQSFEKKYPLEQF